MLRTQRKKNTYDGIQPFPHPLLFSPSLPLSSPLALELHRSRSRSPPFIPPPGTPGHEPKVHCHEWVLVFQVKFFCCCACRFNSDIVSWQSLEGLCILFFFWVQCDLKKPFYSDSYLKLPNDFFFLSFSNVPDPTQLIWNPRRCHFKDFF